MVGPTSLNDYTRIGEENVYDDHDDDDHGGDDDHDDHHDVDDCEYLKL